MLTLAMPNLGGVLAAPLPGSPSAIQRSPNTTQPGGGLSQVSCVSRTFCEAVGSRGDGTGLLTLAEVWRGSRWRVQRSPSPFSLVEDTLSGVSCVSPAFCEAVGYNVLTDAVFAERWNGVSWRVQPLPASAGFGAVVSCASATFCEAVGSGAARWNGTSWRGQRVPKPAGTSFIDLTGVSCVSARFCDAVGASSDGAAAVGWHGTSWRSQAVPLGFEASASRLAGVWCAVAGTCEAAGQITAPGANRPGHSCTAVGSASDLGGIQATLIETGS